jgi:hypothetical protein
VLATTILTRVAESHAHLLQVFSKAETPRQFDVIICGRHPKAHNDLQTALKSIAPVHLVGDVVAPRSAHEAFREGDRCGRTI